MLRVFCESLFSLPLMCYIIYVMINHKYPLKKSILIMTLFMTIITASDMHLAWRGLSYNQITDYYFITTIIPSFICFYIISKSKGFYFIFIYVSTCLFASISNILSSMIIYLMGTQSIIVRIFFRTIILILFCLCAKFILSKPFLSASKYIKSWAVYSLFPLLLNFSCTMTMNISKSQFSPTMIRVPYIGYIYPQQIWYYLILFVSIVITYYFIADIIFNFQKSHDAQELNRNFAMQINGLSRQIENYNTSELSMKIVRHDLKHHFNNIDSLLKSGQYNEAQQYIENMQTELTKIKVEKFCNNPVVNSVLSVTAQRAKEENIILKMDINIPEKISIKPLELSVVLSNALENAINATRKVTDREKIISVVFITLNDKMIFKVSNPYTGKINFDSNHIPLNNEDGHGYGTKSILAFCKRYNSIIDCDDDNGVFTLRILVENI